MYSQDISDYNYEYALIEAARQKMIGNVNEAIKLYNKCIEVNPKSDIAYYELGTIFAAFQKDSLSVDYLKTAYSLKPKNFWYVSAYSQMLRQTSHSKKSLKVLKSYYRIDKDKKIRFMIAESYADLKKYKKALNILDELEKNGFSEMIVMKKIEIYKTMGEFEKGKIILNRLIQLFPESIEYHLIMAEFLQDSNDISGAVQSFRSAFRLDSTNIYAISFLVDYYMNKKDEVNSLYYLSRAFSLMEIPVEKKISTLLYILKNEEDFKDLSIKMDTLVRQVLILYPDNIDVKLVAYDYYFNFKQATTAYEILKEIIEVKKDNYGIWQQIVYNASFLGKYDDLVHYSREALSIFPNKREMALFLGIGEFQNKDYGTALITLSEAYSDTIKEDMKIQFLTFIAEANYKLNNTEKAFQLFDSLLSIDSTNIAIMNNYSYYLALEKKDLPKALAMSKKTILAEPENYTYLDTYAWVLFESGNYPEARVYLEKVIQGSETKSADILFHYAEIMNKLGEKDVALSYYIKARDAGYSEVDVNKIINSL